MSARVVDVEDRLVTLRVTGKLNYAELTAMQADVAIILKELGTIRVLVLAEDFEGWEKGGNWGNVSFQTQFDDHVERMAIVAEQEWEDLIALFTAKGLRRFPIEYFIPKDIGKARLWLAEAK